MKVDTTKIWFHGSSESLVDHLDAPSFQHPFYVTSDLHYAMAFCTKKQSQTGDWSMQKTYTPSSSNYVYAVSLKPNCKVFDFRDHNTTEFKKLYKIIDKDIFDWVFKINSKSFDMRDIFEFVAALQGSIIKPIDLSKANYLEYTKLFGTEPEIMTPKLFSKACEFCKKNELYETWSDFSIHETMAPILKGLNKLGFQGILTKEQDYNEDLPVASNQVDTEFAIGIFDVKGLDQIGLVPMKYRWLKEINPEYVHGKTSQDANEKVKRFIQLYKQISIKEHKMNESMIDLRKTWYFGNNRSKNLKLASPKWYAPFFMTTDYKYAEDYADYGVYTITLKSEAKSKILDFDKDSDVKKLKWPKALIDDIRTGKSDLNGIAYDMYILAGYGHSQEVFDKSWHLSDAAYDFDVRSENIFDIVPKHANWAREKDHRFVLQMWKDIYDAGFDGFTHIEFGKKILALFDFKCMDKISIKPAAKKIDESKQTYLQKYANEPDAKKIVDTFWQIKSRLSTPQNDIDWWIKKPFNDLKSFVQNFDTSNKRQRRDANYKQQAIDNGAKLLDAKDGYEIWYVPTYDAMVAIGRFYKGRSAKWCVASDDPDFWFDNHEDSEFVVLIREHPQHDEFDKVAIEMMNHGRYYNEDDIIPWDLENEDWTFDRGVIGNSEELIHYAWQLFKDNGETREQYFG